MQKISSGIDNLDTLLDSFYIGDNVVWEVDSGTPYKVFLQNFISQAFDDSQKIIYVSFNRSPQSILRSVENILKPEQFVLVDCFTSGKGKNDKTFVKFYDDPSDIEIIRIDKPIDIEQFTQTLNSIEDSFPPGARYIFDSLTGMQDLWCDENNTYGFFTYMCPRLFDLDTVAYWILDKEAHSKKFKANLRHITQVVLDIYKRREMLYIKALKLDGRQDRAAFKPHVFEIDGGDITIKFQKKDISTYIGSKLKEARIRLGINQKELADKIDLSPSFISQVENSQISPSLSSFLQICSALGINPGDFLEVKKTDIASWLIKGDTVLSSPAVMENGIYLHTIISDEKKSAMVCIFPPNTTFDRHFFRHRPEEFIYVLKGAISVIVEGQEERLDSGDTVYLKEKITAQWRNEGGDDAQLLVVC